MCAHVVFMYILLCAPGIFPFIGVLIFEFGSLSLSLSLSHTLIQYGNVPLGAAAWKGHTKTVQRLLEAGAKVNHQSKVMIMFYCISDCDTVQLLLYTIVQSNTLTYHTEPVHTQLYWS